MDIENQLRQHALSQGASFFGAADLNPALQAVQAQGGEIVTGYPRAISLGITLLHTIVNQLPKRQTERAAAINYQHHAYELVNQRLDMLTSQLSGFIQSSGYRALPIPASKRVDSVRICAVFSHKMAAHLAGLGWIGKSCLLVTPEAGPRVRWATILTDTPLHTAEKPLEERCGDCRECIDICPVRAFNNHSFKPDEPREVRFDASKCDQYLRSMKEKDPDTAVCGMCLYVCPHGRKQTKKVMPL